jgi:hypothetical protein
MVEGGTVAGAVVRSQRGDAMTAKTIVNWLKSVFEELDLEGSSSHSGRRTFVTRAARLIHKAGGSLRTSRSLPVTDQLRRPRATLRAITTHSTGWSDSFTRLTAGTMPGQRIRLSLCSTASDPCSGLPLRTISLSPK